MMASFDESSGEMTLVVRDGQKLVLLGDSCQAYVSDAEARSARETAT